VVFTCAGELQVIHVDGVSAPTGLEAVAGAVEAVVLEAVVLAALEAESADGGHDRTDQEQHHDRGLSQTLLIGGVSNPWSVG
jgi:hypothetical protein